MTSFEICDKLKELQINLNESGYARTPYSSAATLARAFADSTYPLQVFLEWIARSPEIQEILSGVCAGIRDHGTSPPDSSQKSETKSRPVSGGSIPSVTVDAGNAAAILGRTGFTTRSADPREADEPGFLGEGVVIRGAQARLVADGKPLTARAKLSANGFRVVEFLDVKGPILMMRITEGKEKGMIVNGPIQWVEPDKRTEVLAALAELPGSLEEFNFNPFEGCEDPWLEKFN